MRRRHSLDLDPDGVMYDDDDDIAAGGYPPVGIERALGAMDAIGAAPSPNGAGMPVRGQRAIFGLVPGGNTLDTGTVYSLARAEDARASYWQVTLSPLYRLGVGAIPAGMPASTLNGAPLVRMTWGGGGVTYRVDFEYPVAGASFCVAGDNVMLDVRATDGVSVFTPADIVACNAWVSPMSAAPTSAAPLVLWTTDAAFFGPLPMSPFARVLLVALDTLTATGSVQFQGALGNTTVALPAGVAVHRVPIPASAQLVTVLCSAGFLSVGQELAFT